MDGIKGSWVYLWPLWVSRFQKRLLQELNLGARIEGKATWTMPGNTYFPSEKWVDSLQEASKEPITHPRRDPVCGSRYSRTSWQNYTTKPLPLPVLLLSFFFSPHPNTEAAVAAPGLELEGQGQDKQWNNMPVSLLTQVPMPQTSPEQEEMGKFGTGCKMKVLVYIRLGLLKISVLIIEQY